MSSGFTKRTDFSRRSVLGGGVAAMVALVLGRGFVHAQDATPTPLDGVQSDGTWVFTDDRGVTVTASALPQTIVAQTSSAAALYDFGIGIAGIYGPSVDADGAPDFQAGDLPLDEIEVLGDYGADTLEIDIEKLIAIDPDLVADNVTYEGQFWYLVGDARSRVEELQIPVVGISMGKESILTVIQRYEALAGALGADLQAPQVVEDKAAQAASETTMKTAIVEKPGLSVLCISAGLENVYVASPRYMTDLMYFADLGLDVVDHQTDDYFELLSWEEIGKYPADVIINDARPGTPTAEEIAESVPLWNTLPAVQAAQVGKWYAAAPWSYGRFAPIMDELTALIETSDPDIV